MELLQYWKVIRKSLWLIILVTVVGLGATAFYTVRQPPQYQSEATLLLNARAQSDLNTSSKVALTDMAEGYTVLMRTRAFGEAVVAQLPFSLSAGKVSGAVSTELEPKTAFYKITGVLDSPVKAQQLVSSTIDNFLLMTSVQQEQQAAVSEEGAAFREELRQSLVGKLDEVRGQIKQIQAEIQGLEALPPSKERNDYLITLRGQLVALQTTEVTTIDNIVKLTTLNPAPVLPATAFVVDPPRPGKPLDNGMMRNLMLALVMSLLVGVGIAFGRDYLDYTIRSPEYLERVIGLSPVTAIGKLNKNSGPFGNRKHALAGRRLVTIEQPQSPASESFRMLRTNIQLLSPDKPIRSLVVTSVSPKEGKSFTAANLAIVMAQAGNRVILVDADLRKSSLHELFGLPNNVGFADLLSSKTPNVASVIQMAPGVDNLAIITTGPLPENPSELLNSQQAAQIMAQLAQQVDVVIYDTPPAGVAIDPIIMATRADSVILVVNAGSTRREMVVRVKHSLQNIGVVAILPVLNRVGPRDLGGYYYSQYYDYSRRRTQGVGGPPNGHIPGQNGRTAVTSVEPASKQRN